MSAKRFEGRFVLFTNALLLSTALASPAAAQIEEVVVTAQKRTEDVQSVPIAVTAFTGKDLKTQQIDQFKDLQFHSPNVTFTTGALGGTDFQIRGIGITAVGYDAEIGRRRQLRRSVSQRAEPDGRELLRPLRHRNPRRPAKHALRPRRKRRRGQRQYRQTGSRDGQRRNERDVRQLRHAESRGRRQSSDHHRRAGPARGR